MLTACATYSYDGYNVTRTKYVTKYNLYYLSPQTFLCQKYGYRPFPPNIPASLFDLLRDTLVSGSKPVDLLDEWFLLDENTLPPVYQLQPISSKLPYFSRQDEAEKMKADQGVWWRTFETIQSQLKWAAKCCLSEGKVTEEQARQFIISGRWVLHLEQY